MNLVNLTPHPVIVYDANGDTLLLTIPSSGEARCAQVRELVGTCEYNGVEVPLYSTSFGQVSGVPDPQYDTLYIVSALTAQALLGQRDDLVIPDNMVRNSTGQVVGCRGFAFPTERR